MVDEDDLGRRIYLHHKVLKADFDSATAQWTVALERDGEHFEVTCDWLFGGATGYYDYAGGHRPHFEGEEDFEGRIVHPPQSWPEDLDYTGKKVVVIGSGATAVTLIPAMAGEVEHITMLQRSPSYVMPLPRKDPPIANSLRKVLPAKRLRRDSPLQHRQGPVHLQPVPAPSQAGTPDHPLVERQSAAGRLRGRHPLQPHLQPVGSALVRGARRGPVPHDRAG